MDKLMGKGRASLGPGNQYCLRAESSESCRPVLVKRKHRLGEVRGLLNMQKAPLQAPCLIPLLSYKVELLQMPASPREPLRASE